MRVKKLRESDKRGGKEVLSPQGKAIPMDDLHSSDPVYTSIAIFVTVVTLAGFGMKTEVGSY